jgi:hypothetical protein
MIDRYSGEMVIINTFLKALAGVAMITLACGTAEATSIIDFTDTFASPTDFSHTFTLQEFDTNLGTLTGVEIDLYGTLTTPTLNLTNTAADAESFKFLADTEIYTTNNTASNDNVDTFPNFPQPPNNNLIILNTGTISLGGAGTGIVECPNSTPSQSCNQVSYAPLTVNDVLSPATTTVASANWGGYEHAGGGSFNIVGVTATEDSFLGGGGNNQFKEVTDAQLTARVIYSYDAPAVPEPGSMLLMGGAMIGLGLLGKRLRN